MIANLEAITGMQSWCKNWLPNGSNRIRVKQKASQETEKSLRKFLEPTAKPKVTHTDNSLEFGKASEESSWNHLESAPKPMVLLRERHAESRNFCSTVAIQHGSKVVG